MPGRLAKGADILARMPKVGLDYFSLDVNFLSHIKVRRIIRACGLQSVPILVQLLSNIYKYKGYYIVWNEDECFAVADDVGTAERAVEEVVVKAIQVDFFNECMWKTYGVLTSRRIQQQYFDAVSKRKSVDYDGRFLLISLKTVKNAINVDINRINSTMNPQSKGKESKGKESKGDKTIVEQARPDGTVKHIIEHLNDRTGKCFKANTAKTQMLIHARLAEGFTETDFFTVIDKKAQEWLGDSKMDRYLRPETLFGTKFEGYLNEQTIRPQQTKAQQRINATRYLVGELTEMERLHESRDSSVAGEDDTGILPAGSVETVPEY